MRKTFLFLLTLALTLPSFAQGLAGAKNLDKVVSIHLGYGPFATAGDLSDRFGNGFALDGGASFTLANSNLEFGFKAQFGFGTQVKEDVLADFRTSDGFIIGNQREPADIQLRQRQLFLGPSLGYTFRIGRNQRAGIHLKTSPGYFFHYIRFQEDALQNVPQLNEELRAGYDQLTGGFAIHQFIGYQQLAQDRLFNFYIGGELMAGFTKALRDFDFNLAGPPDTSGRVDLLLGVKAGLIIPFYIGEGREIFY